MGVLDGEPVSQAITNPAFINKNQDDVMPNVLGFDNPGSGTAIDNIQEAINTLWTTTGATETVAGTVYDAPASTIANGDSHELSLYLLAAKFDPATGHAHSGAAGDGGPILAASITSVPLLGYFVPGIAPITGASGTGTTITALMAGKAASYSAAATGVVVTAPYNRAWIGQGATGDGYGEPLFDTSGNLIYGRVTESSGTWTMAYYSKVLGVETAYSFSSPTTLLFYAQELYNPLQPTPTYTPAMFMPLGGGGGSGGGGGGLIWNAEGPFAAVQTTEFNQSIFAFGPAPLTQYAYTSFEIPASQSVGTQLFLYATGYSPSTSNNFYFTVQTTLIRKNTDAMSSTTNQNTANSSTFTNTVANQARGMSIALTDSSGLINGVAYSAGDLLLIRLELGSSTTDTDVVRFVISSAQVSA